MTTEHIIRPDRYGYLIVPGISYWHEYTDVCDWITYIISSFAPEKEIKFHYTSERVETIILHYVVYVIIKG